MKLFASFRAARLQVSLRELFVVVLVAAAFCGGWAFAQRRAEKAIQAAQEAADLARRQEEEARKQLEAEWYSRTIPCHPGCFPAGTRVLVPQGTMPIEGIREGDLVVTIGADGHASTAQVVSVFVTRNRLLNVRTDSGTLETTETQPICLDTGEMKAAGKLKAGERIWRWDGTARKAATVRDVTPSKIAQVFNLVLGDPTIFIAGDFLVRSKPPAAD